MKALGLLITLLLVTAAASGGAAERRVALVIGNSAYANAEPLANPVNDAKVIGAALERLGFEALDYARGMAQRHLRITQSECPASHSTR